MPKDNIKVELSRADRQLLRDVVDAIRSLKPEDDRPERAPHGVTRLVEDKSKRPDVSAVFKREVEWR